MRRPLASAALRIAAYAVAAVGVALFLQRQSPGVPGYDALYHFRHADLYVQHGLWMKSFPWIAYSTMNQFSGDIGYGFHLFLVPFTFLHDEMWAIKLAAAVETAIVLLILYLVLRRHRVTYAFAWPWLLLFLGAPVTYTFMMTRPQILTMGFFALLLSFMVKGTARGVLLASLGFAFFHLNAFPVVLVVVAAVAIVKGIVESQWEWTKWLAALGGIGLAWLLRPNPIGVAKLEYHQIVVHEVARYTELPLLFGREWGPVTLPALGAFALPLLLWAAACFVVMAATASRRVSITPNERTFLWSNLVLSGLFFAAAVVSTKRAIPLWATCAVIVPATAYTLLASRSREGEEPLLERPIRLALTCALAAMLGALMWNGLRADATHAQWVQSAQRPLERPAQWLRDNGRPGEIVYNVGWAMFPELFFWNTEDHYVCGLDPVFLYAYDPQLYWKFHHIATGQATEHTYSSPTRSSAAAVDTYAFVRDDLRASYVILYRAQHPALDRYLESDDRFSLAFDDEDVAIYAVGAAPPPGTAEAAAGTRSRRFAIAPRSPSTAHRATASHP